MKRTFILPVLFAVVLFLPAGCSARTKPPVADYRAENVYMQMAVDKDMIR
ncbi:MAG: hypothetical protein IKR95_03490 [Oscillospiraceae bacterium]|jgi:hypothetical protein|nr:hypothetical protein [Oscillospiraceae bacterium]